MVSQKLEDKVIRYIHLNYRKSEKEIDLWIRKRLRDFELNTKIQYYKEIREIIHNEGYTHLSLSTPNEWIQLKHTVVNEKYKQQQIEEIDKDHIIQFMEIEMDVYNPYHEFLRLCIISGRRGEELLYNEFEIIENELWYIPCKKKENKYCKIQHLLFGYTPDMFMSELERVRNSFSRYNSFHSIRRVLIPYSKQMLGTTKIHRCRSIYVLFLLDMYKKQYHIDTNNQLYYVQEWLNHDTIRSSNRYLQYKWK